MASQLNYQLLEKLVGVDADHCLKIVKIGVTRFGDDTSEIRLGETVPFVANVKFVVTEPAHRQLRGDLGVVIGETLFWINNRGEIKTDLESAPGVPIEVDSDSVARWVSDHFEFTFHVRGVDRSVFRPYRREPVSADQFRTVEPWLQEINTTAVRGEVIDIDFDVKPKLPDVRPVRKVLLSTDEVPALFEQATLGLRLEVHGRYDSVAKLKNGRYWIPLHSDDDPDLKLAVVVESVTEARPSTPPDFVQRPRHDSTTQYPPRNNR